MTCYLLAAYALLSQALNAAGHPMNKDHTKKADVSGSPELMRLNKDLGIDGWGQCFFEQGAAELTLRFRGAFEAVLLGSPDLFMSPTIDPARGPIIFWHGY